ncbi:Uncharacterised protein [Budvicia aquatica]|uniref:Uncharacterized protein n=1 Tax=Budvicia aquatica TaxID=82979 RepID=A0A484ZL91_9GAMM|nr:Uncharacterised protein [Budvicia aquatica]
MAQFGPYRRFLPHNQQQNIYFFWRPNTDILRWVRLNENLVTAKILHNAKCDLTKETFSLNPLQSGKDAVVKLSPLLFGHQMEQESAAFSSR